MLNWKHLTGLVCMASGLAQAHLSANTLSPKGGETVKVGDVVTISWDVEQAHQNGIDIALSKNNGTNWANIKSGYADDESGTDTFKWTVPADAVTAQAKIRICQYGPCSDAQNTNNPGGSKPWRLVSGTFTIQAATGIAQSAASADMSIDIRPSTRNVEVSFEMAETGPVALQAFDSQGRLVATLIQGNYAAGTHSLSVFSNRLDANAGTLVFKLQAGDKVKTHTWLQLR